MGVIEDVAEQRKVPSWWVEAVAIEYLDCRVFAGDAEIWDFRLEDLDPAALGAALDQSRVVILHGTIYDNVHPNVLRERLAGRLVSRVPVPLVTDERHLIPNGAVSAYHTVLHQNSLHVWDPKLSFSGDFQVLEDGTLWQWRIAEFVKVEGRNYGKWVSDEVDLEALDEIHPRLAELRNRPVRPGQPGHTEFADRVKELYAWVDEIRKPIREALYEIHKRRREELGDSSTVTSAPPLLSKFEEFSVRDGEVATRFHVEPVLYRTCVVHSRQATEIGRGEDAEYRLDEIYQERIETVICAAACLEAFINAIGQERVPRWELYEQLPVKAKWHLCLVSCDEEERFQPDREPYQTLGKVVELRNRWLHYDRTSEKVRRSGKGAITWIEAKMSRDFVERIPDRIRELIEELCSALKIPAPPWLRPAAGWEL